MYHHRDCNLIGVACIQGFSAGIGQESAGHILGRDDTEKPAPLSKSSTTPESGQAVTVLGVSVTCEPVLAIELHVRAGNPPHGWSYVGLARKLGDLWTAGSQVRSNDLGLYSVTLYLPEPGAYEAVFARLPNAVAEDMKQREIERLLDGLWRPFASIPEPFVEEVKVTESNVCSGEHEGLENRIHAYVVPTTSDAIGDAPPLAIMQIVVPRFIAPPATGDAGIRLVALGLEATAAEWISLARHATELCKRDLCLSRWLEASPPQLTGFPAYGCADPRPVC
jgi:hypothetical protein